MRAAVMTCAAIVALPLSARAQGGVENAQVPVRVEVLSIPLNVDVVGVTDFGPVLNAGGDVSLHATAPGPQQSTAVITIGTSPSTGVLVSLGPCVTFLTQEAGSEEVGFTPQFAVNSQTDVQADADLLDQCLSDHVDFPNASGPDPSLRYMHLWLGGKVTLFPGQAPGLYTGVQQITVEIL